MSIFQCYYTEKLEIRRSNHVILRHENLESHLLRSRKYLLMLTLLHSSDVAYGSGQSRRASKHSRHQLAILPASGAAAMRFLPYRKSKDRLHSSVSSSPKSPLFSDRVSSHFPISMEIVNREIEKVSPHVIKKPHAFEASASTLSLLFPFFRRRRRPFTERAGTETAG